MVRVDLRSDTVTSPTPAMRRAMADEQLFQTFLNRSDDYAEFRAARAEDRTPIYTGF